MMSKHDLYKRKKMNNLNPPKSSHDREDFQVYYKFFVNSTV